MKNMPTKIEQKNNAGEIACSQELNRNRQLLSSINKAQSLFILESDPKILFSDLLSDLVSLTDSEYGFIGEVLYNKKGDPYLKTHAITDISWNEETHKFHEDNVSVGLEFHNLKTLFGSALTKAKVVISNDPLIDDRRGGIPDGHPPLNSFLGIPFFFSKQIIGMVGIANKPGGYSQKEVDFLHPMLATCAIIIEGMKNTKLRKNADEKIRMDNINLELQITKRTEELNKSKRLAENANKAKSDFLSKMSHEIRTPINGVSGMAHLLMDTELTQTQRHYVKTIQFSSTSLLTLINDILDLSKIESGKMDLEIIDFDLWSMMEEINNLMITEAHKKGLKYIFHIDPDVPAIVSGDIGRLRQILYNIIGNAVKFTSKGEIRIQINHIRTEELKDKNAIPLKFSIKDTGIGIADEKIEMVLNPFVQADVSTTRQYGGSGLGLTISKNLTELMGGQFGLESKVGGGSTFWFTIALKKSKPVKKVSAGLPEETPLDKNKGETEDKPDEKDDIKATPLKTTQEPILPHDTDLMNRKQQFRILLAEDYPINQEIFKRFLSKSGFSADIAENGKEAVAALEKKPYDLVLMDIEMPIMDGFDAARKIRSPHSMVLNHHVPIIAVSAYVGKKDILKCHDAGMDGHLGKPINPEVLENLLNKYFCEKESLKDPSLIQNEPEKEINTDSATFEESKKDSKKTVLNSKKSIFDKDELLHRVRGDKQFFKEMLELFFDLAPDEIKILKSRLQENDIEQTKKQAHKLKGSFSNIAAHSLRDFAFEIETAAGNDDITEARQVFKKMETEFIRFLQVAK